MLPTRTYEAPTARPEDNNSLNSQQPIQTPSHPPSGPVESITHDLLYFFTAAGLLYGHVPRRQQGQETDSGMIDAPSSYDYTAPNTRPTPSNSGPAGLEATQELPPYSEPLAELPPYFDNTSTTTTTFESGSPPVPVHAKTHQARRRALSFRTFPAPAAVLPRRAALGPLPRRAQRAADQALAPAHEGLARRLRV
ncbi:hypothetical protein PG994_013594 [Apiospora phragmitis]|uniref:Uncharacterized protein n=1 Tax=Apiospora phragmitis TaxID=2905665 RepID=A0ABR1T926_9PEZI